MIFDTFSELNYSTGGFLYLNSIKLIHISQIDMNLILKFEKDEIKLNNIKMY